MGLFGNHARVGASAGSSDYEIERSLKFNEADTTYLDRNVTSSGNRKTHTFSAWIKRTDVADYNLIYTQGDGAGNEQFYVHFNNNDQLEMQQYDYPSNQGRLITTQKFRDSSAWYHIVIRVDTTDSTADDRFRMYVNGSQITSFGTRDNPAEDLDTWINDTTYNFRLGVTGYNGMKMNGYMSEINFIDGSSLGPDSFGKTDTITGAWIAKKYTGSYGTNGFYLKFSDNSGTTATTLGKDSAGSNNFTPNNFITGDSVNDSPTNNFATLFMQRTPYESGATITDGMLHFNSGTGTSARNMNKTSMSNFLVNSGKWYAEFWFTTASAGNMVGVCPYEDEAGSATTNGAIYGTRFGDGNKYIGDGVLAYPNNYWAHGSSYGDGDVIMVMLDMDSSPPRMYTGKNGQWADGSGNDDEAAPDDYLTLGNNFLTTNASMAGYLGFLVVSGGAASNCNAIANFGQDSTFSGKTTAGGNTDSEGYGNFKYTVPTGAKAMCSKNLPEPSIKNGADYFRAKIYSGTGSTQTITTGIEANLVWVKRRDGSNYNILANTISGAGNYLVSNTTDAESSGGSQLINGFSATGFQVGTETAVNNSSGTYVSWNWKESVSAGFDIITYTGNGVAGRTVAHNLGVAPEVVICKRRNGTEDWKTNVGPILGSGNEGHHLTLNNDTAVSTGSSPFNDANPTSSNIVLGTNQATNGDGDTYIAFAFASVAGYSKMGQYIGNNNNDGTFVYIGFRPAYILIKRLSAGGNYWEARDNKRNPGNTADLRLFPNTADSESTGEGVDFLANGFKVRNTGNGSNASGSTYLYMAFAETSFKYANAR